MAASPLRSREAAVRDVVRQCVLEEAAKRWKRIHATRFPAVLFSPLFGTRKLERIFVVEHDCADVTQMVCTGTAIAAWRYDDSGLVRLETGDIDPGPAHGHLFWGSLWHRQIWRFYIGADSSSAIINEEEGPGDVWVSENAVVVRGEKVRLKCRRARWEETRPRTWWNWASEAWQYGIALGLVVILLIVLRMILG